MLHLRIRKSKQSQRVRERSLNDSLCILQIYRKQIKWCQCRLPNEVGWGCIVDEDTTVAKLSNCCLLFLKNTPLNTHMQTKMIKIPSDPVFPPLQPRTGKAEASLSTVRASSAPLNNSLCHKIPGYSHIPITSCCNSFLFQMLPACLARQRIEYYPPGDAQSRTEAADLMPFPPWKH